MPRRPPRTRPRPARVEPKTNPTSASEPAPEPQPTGRPFWNRWRLALAVAGLLALHWALAVQSLLGENPTVDEVIHLPAGVSYWQTGTFKLYPHNPPLIKLVAAWPVVRADPATAPLYRGIFWNARNPNKTGFGHEFANRNAARYFELFDRARLLMPWFTLIGGLFVFAWSRQLYGDWAGLLSLSLWCLCPNVLAHTRLITSDAGATALGFAATYLFWRYLRRPSWGRALLAGLVLGLAELAKFSLLLLYGLWPLLWLIHELARGDRQGLGRRVRDAALHGVAIVGLSVLLIDLGYGFEGVGTPLGKLPFVSGTLTRPRERPLFMEPRPDDLLDRIREYRVNRFVGTPLENLPIPLPRYYLTGFDEQKLEADGVWTRFVMPTAVGDAMPPAEADRIVGYPVYLDGVLRDRSWWYYYILTLVYKMPEGTWALVLGSLAVLFASRRARGSWADELSVLLVPIVVLGVMSFLTNINLGLRYVLPIFPYLFVSAGKLAPWAAGLAGGRKRLATAAIGLALTGTAAATATIHPHYLAYFNQISGGPDRGSEHLIDSNLDWGQDLVGLREWLRANAPGERVGLAYFGQINPRIFAERGDGFDWFLPPALPGKMDLRPTSHVRDGRLVPPPPGLYAVSASLLRGLDWRVYSPPEPGYWEERGPGRLRHVAGVLPRDYWKSGRFAYTYFQRLKPVAQVGHSIFLYRLNEADAARLARLW